MNARVKNTLTFQDSISILLSKDKEIEIVNGIIRTKSKCPVCQNKFTEIKKLGFIYTKHKTTPERFYIDFWYQGQRLKLYSDNQGQILDTYRRAETLLSRVDSEIKRHTFDSTRYVKQELKK